MLLINLEIFPRKIRTLFLITDPESEREGILRPNGRILHWFRQSIRLRQSIIRSRQTHEGFSQWTG